MADEKPNPPPAPAPTPQVHSWLIDGLRLASIIPAFKLTIMVFLGAFAWLTYTEGSNVVRAFLEEMRRTESQPDAAHARALTDAVVRSRSHNALLTSLLESSQASRAGLWQFHNGTSTLAGIPFLRISQTNVVSANGVATLQEQYQGLPLQIIIEWIPRLLAGECIDQPIGEASPSLEHLMRDGNIDRLVICPVFITGLREPVGFLSLSYSKGWPQPTDIQPVFGTLRASSVAAGAILAAYRESQQR